MTDLERLARDRPQVTRELHLPSAFYGHAHALARYAGLPDRARPKVAIEHGIGFTDFVWDVDLDAPVPTFLCAAPDRARRYAELADADRVAVPIGPMILYAPPAEPRPGRRLVVFPAHSTHHVDAAYDVESFAGWLEARRGDWDEVEVCLYWRDALRGVGAAYAERGFRCLTAGHIYDPLFLTRLRAILDGAAVVASNETGTFVFYAVALGKPVWIRPGDIHYDASAEVLGRDQADVANARVAELRAAFADERDTVSAEQRALVEELAGLDSHRSPAELADLLAAAERRYRDWGSSISRLRAVASTEAVRAAAGLRRLTGRF